MFSDYPVDPSVVRDFVRVKARSLVGLAWLAPQDRDDLEQELFRRVWRRVQRYDVARGTVAAFVAAVLDREVAEFLRERRALKRGLGRTVSLNDPAVDSARPPFASRDDGPDRAALRADVTHVLNGMSSDHQTLAVDLMTGSPAQVARDRGLAPSSLMRKIEAIRRRFRDAGFGPFP